MRSPLARIQLSLPALLACMLIAAVLPLACMVGWQLYDDVVAERNRSEDELVRAAAAFAQSVEGELASSIDALRVLSESELFQQGRIAAMGRLLHGRPRRDWDSIFLLDPQGGVVLDTAARPAPAASFRELHQLAMGRLAPVVSGLGDAGGIAIAIPVMQGGQARYVLGARLTNTLWARLAGTATLPAGSQARLYDRDGRLISQSGSIAPAGARLPPGAALAMIRRKSGVERSSEADGNDVFAAWDSVPLAGWHARVFVAAAPLDAARHEMLLHALSTSGAALLAGMLVAGVVAAAILRRVRRHDAALRRRDEALAQQDWRDEFVAMLTHEVRNPLGAISAAADVLESTHPTSASAADARAVISRQARLLSQMMHALLDASRAITGKLNLSRRAVDLGALVRNVEETLALTGESRQHPIVLDIAADVWVDADPVRMEEVVSNLLIHAAKRTPPGDDIRVRVSREGDSALLAIEAARVETRPLGTPGIEWTLARALVALHSGTLEAHASPQFNEVVARLPAVQAPAASGGDAALPPSRRRKVLLLQRDARASPALRANLELDGHTVAVARSEEEALFCVVEQRPDVMLVELGPASNATLDFARRVRGAGYAGRMIALATEPGDRPAREPREAREAREAGFDEVVTPPVDFRSLRDTVASRD